MFDVNTFMSSASDPMATKYEIPPEGEFKMTIDSDAKAVQPREIKFTDRETGEPRSFHQLELTCVVLDDKVKQTLGREKVTVRLRVNLDLNGEGKLDNGPNKNVQLGKLRDALGQNKPGWTPASLLGAGPFIGKISHTSDKKDSSVKYADVTKVAKIA